MSGQDSWRGKRATVMGLGTRGGGSGVARYLAEQGAAVSITDLRSAAQLAEQIAELSDLDLRLVLGEHVPTDFTDVDVVVRNPAVRRTNPYLAMAREAGVAIEMEMTIFLRACPARVIGITGTKGKTTTSALCAAMLQQARSDTVLAGNMGVSALAALPAIEWNTPVVLELSSWQLEEMDERAIGPAIAVITNVSEDHLDTYADFAEYAVTKRSISSHLQPGSVLIVNADDGELNRPFAPTGVRQINCGTNVAGPNTVRIADRVLEIQIDDIRASIDVPPSFALRGDHQVMNAALAAASALSWGASIEDVLQGLASFTGVANRMELVAEIDGVLYVNDTAATAPAAAIASLKAWGDRPIHLIAGGADKRLGFAEMARSIAEHASSVVLLDGTATPVLDIELDAAGWTGSKPVVHSMSDALAKCRANADRGSVVLLSPGCASFGLFRDEFDRGDQFRSLVLAESTVSS